MQLIGGKLKTLRIQVKGRNLGNKYSYTLIGEDSKHERKNSYYYDFIEQDYLDAL